MGAQDVGLDMKMISNLPDIMAKEPEKRGEFEVFIMDKFGEALAKIAEVYGEASVQTEEANTAAVVDAKGDATRAAEAKDDCIKALAEAKAAVKAGKKSEEEAQHAVENYLRDMQKVF